MNYKHLALHQPNIESYDIFQLKVNKRCCPICNQFTSKEKLKYSLCKLSIHYSEGSECLKESKDFDIVKLKYNFYYYIYLKRLIKFQKDIEEKFDINKVLNYLQSFNLDSIDIHTTKEIDTLKIAISKLI